MSFLSRVLGCASLLALVSCGSTSTSVEGQTGPAAAGGGGGNGDGVACADGDRDGHRSCNGDCADDDADVHPGAVENANGLDDDCDGKIDNKIPGRDFDGDGVIYPNDCNDDDKRVGPEAIEIPGDGIDNDCNVTVDEPLPPCDSGLDASAGDFARSIGLCSHVIGSEFVLGLDRARKIRSRFGTQWTPKQGETLAMLSTGDAKDNLDDASYWPQDGTDLGQHGLPHPLYTSPRCGAVQESPYANDMTELKLTLEVPQNALGLSYQFIFFSAEYPEYVCSEFNDRFVALLESRALDVTQGPLAGNCKAGAAVPTCNISFDEKGQPVTINNGFFDVCESKEGKDPRTGTRWKNECTKPVSMLEKTGYDRRTGLLGFGDVAGGATGWLTTRAPVTPGETVTLRFIIFDEGDDILDSAVLIDNFKWETTAVGAPSTEPVLN